MGGQNIKLDLLYIQSILHNSGSNPGLRVLFFSPPISLPRSVPWTLYVPSEPLHGPFKLCFFLSRLSYLTSRARNCSVMDFCLPDAVRPI